MRHAVLEHGHKENRVYAARDATEMILATFESHRLGRPVNLPLKNRQHPLTMLSS